MVDVYEIIERYYADNKQLKDILLEHSIQVKDRALRIAQNNKQLNLDEEFLAEAALLHDIGIVLTDAPGISCVGTEPYIRHGILGAEILRKEGLERHARVCERHTGTGLTLNIIEERNLPLPRKDFSPESWEEIVICYADKFYSKSKLGIEKTPEHVARSLAKHGEEVVQRFWQWKTILEA